MRARAALASLETLTRRKRQNGEEMTSEQTANWALPQAREKRLKCEGMGNTTLHSEHGGPIDTALIVFTADEHGRIIAPCDGLMLATYLRDQAITVRASKLHQPTDISILPIEHLHITPQTRAGLHGHEGDIDRSRVPVSDVALDDVLDINNYRAEYRAPVAPAEEIE